MNNKDELGELRKQIQEIDMQLVDLLSDRMDAVEKISAYKRKNDIQVEDRDREKNLEELWQQKAVGKNIKETEISIFLNTLLKISKDRQRNL